MSFLYPITLEKCLNLILAILFITLGIIFFQDAHTFTYIFYSVLLFSAYLCRRQPGLLAIVLAILVTNLLEEPVWHFLLNYDSKLLLAVIYLLLGVVIFSLANINGNKYPLRLLWLTMVSAELYWFFTDYPSPIIYPHLYMVAHSVLLLWLLFFRVVWMEKRRNQVTYIDLDRKVSQLTQWFIILQYLHISEYLIRHLTPLKPMIIYNCFPIIVHSINVYMLYLIFNTSYKQWLPRKLTA